MTDSVAKIGCPLTVKPFASIWAWGWCLLKWAVNPGLATSLEPQALGRACRYPWQLCEWQPATDTATLTKLVEIHTNTILTKSTNKGRKGREKSRTDIQLGTQNKLHNLTWLEHTIRAIQETLYVTLRRMISWPPLTSTGLILTLILT